MSSPLSGGGLELLKKKGKNRHRICILPSRHIQGPKGIRCVDFINRLMRGKCLRSIEHLVAEQRLTKVYDHTIDELMSEKRQHNMIKNKLKETTMEMNAAKHENEVIRKKLRSVYKESESWKRQALQVTTSLQEHVKQLKEENKDLALQNSLLKNSYTQTLEYSKEIQRLKASYKALETKHIDAKKDHLFNEKSTEKFYKKFKYANYLYELEKAETKKLNANAKQLYNKLEKSDCHARELRNEIDSLKKSHYQSTVKLQEPA